MKTLPFRKQWCLKTGLLLIINLLFFGLQSGLARQEIILKAEGRFNRPEKKSELIAAPILTTIMQDKKTLPTRSVAPIKIQPVQVQPTSSKTNPSINLHAYLYESIANQDSGFLSMSGKDIAKPAYASYLVSNSFKASHAKEIIRKHGGSVKQAKKLAPAMVKIVSGKLTRAVSLGASVAGSTKWGLEAFFPSPGFWRIIWITFIKGLVAFVSYLILVKK